MPTPIGERGVLNTKAFSDARVFISMPAVMVYMFAAAFIALQASEAVGDTLESRGSGRYTAEVGEGRKTVIYERSESTNGDPNSNEFPCDECGGSKLVAKWNDDKTRVLGTQTCPKCNGAGFTTE